MREPRVVDAPRDGSDGGFVQDEIDAFCAGNHGVAIADVFAKKGEVLCGAGVFAARGVDIFGLSGEKIVDPDDFVPESEGMSEQMRTDESGNAGDEYFCHEASCAKDIIILSI